MSQRLIPTGEKFGLQTRIATTVMRYVVHAPAPKTRRHRSGGGGENRAGGAMSNLSCHGGEKRARRKKTVP